MPGSEQRANKLLSQTGDKGGQHEAGGGSPGGSQAAGLGRCHGQTAGRGSRWRPGAPGRKRQPGEQGMSLGGREETTETNVLSHTGRSRNVLEGLQDPL